MDGHLVVESVWGSARSDFSPPGGFWTPFRGEPEKDQRSLETPCAEHKWERGRMFTYTLGGGGPLQGRVETQVFNRGIIATTDIVARKEEAAVVQKRCGPRENTGRSEAKHTEGSRGLQKARAPR